jgi:iron-sulfur cluster assembly protein
MVRITDSAREKIKEILKDEGGAKLRFGLKGGGCNGFTYFLTLESVIENDDVVVPIDEYQLVIDPMSNMYLEEAEIDYVRDKLMGESFVFNNPNQKSSCGCGNSVGF